MGVTGMAGMGRITAVLLLRLSLFWIPLTKPISWWRMRFRNKRSGEYQAACFLIQCNSESAYSRAPILDVVHRSCRYQAQRAIRQNNEVVTNSIAAVIPDHLFIVEYDLELGHCAWCTHSALPDFRRSLVIDRIAYRGVIFGWGRCCSGLSNPRRMKGHGGLQNCEQWRHSNTPASSDDVVCGSSGESICQATDMAATGAFSALPLFQRGQQVSKLPPTRRCIRQVLRANVVIIGPIAQTVPRLALRSAQTDRLGDCCFKLSVGYIAAVDDAPERSEQEGAFIGHIGRLQQQLSSRNVR